MRLTNAVMQAYVHKYRAGWSSLDVDLAICEHALTVPSDDVPEIVQAVRTRLACGKWGKATA